MPIYEYLCASCAKKTEVIQRMNASPPKVCPHCGGKLKKMASAPAIQFKGSGFYITDYSGKSDEGRRRGRGRESREGRQGGQGGEVREGRHDREGREGGEVESKIREVRQVREARRGESMTARKGGAVIPEHRRGIPSSTREHRNRARDPSSRGSRDDSRLSGAPVLEPLPPGEGVRESQSCKQLPSPPEGGEGRVRGLVQLQPLQILPERPAEVLALEGELDGGLQESQLVAGVVALSLEEVPVDRPPGQQGLQRARELDLAADVRAGLFEDREDLGAAGSGR